jgi:hypothetical protein
LKLGCLTKKQLHFVKQIFYNDEEGWNGVMNSNHKCTMTHQEGMYHVTLEYFLDSGVRPRAQHKLLHYIDTTVEEKGLNLWMVENFPPFLFPELASLVGRHVDKEFYKLDIHKWSLMHKLLLDYYQAYPEMMNFEQLDTLDERKRLKLE